MSHFILVGSGILEPKHPLHLPFCFGWSPKHNWNVQISKNGERRRRRTEVIFIFADLDWPSRSYNQSFQMRFFSNRCAALVRIQLPTRCSVPLQSFVFSRIDNSHYATPSLPCTDRLSRLAHFHAVHPSWSFFAVFRQLSPSFAIFRRFRGN